MDQNIIFPILEYLANRLRPRNLYTDNWLGAGRLDWSRLDRHDNKGIYYHFSVGVDHVIGSPTMQVCPGDDSIGFYENEIGKDDKNATRFILGIADPDFFKKLDVFSWDTTVIGRGRMSDNRLRFGPAPGFKPVVWRPCQVACNRASKAEKILYEGTDIAI